MTEAKVSASAPVAAEETEREERVREGFTMALYVGLSLLAVIVALPGKAEAGTSEYHAALIGLTSLSLLFAHQLAFRLSSRLVHQARLTRANAELLAAQLLGGFAVTVVAVTPVLLIDGAGGLRACELLLLGFVAVVGYRAARSVPVGRARAVGYLTIVVALTLGVLGLKAAVAH